MTLRWFPALLLVAGTAACQSSADARSKATAPPAPARTGPAPAATKAAAGLDLTWHGQSCFVMQTPGGKTILMDPVAYEIGYKPPPVKADVVTISHEHPDHTNLKMVEASGATGSGVTVLRGLTESGDWARIGEATFGDVKVRTVPTFHDDQNGKKFGKNAAFVFDVDMPRGGVRRVVHLGDLGEPLTAEQLAALKPVDVLLVPVGGHYTVGGKAAQAVVDAIAPRFVIFPMHYRTDKLTIKELGGVEPFLEGKADRTVKVDANHVTLDFGPFRFDAPGKVEGPDQLNPPMILVLKP